MKTLDDAIKLSQKMVAIGEAAGKKTVALITDMDIPLGYAIGNSLEIIEVVNTLKGKGPKDLTEVCLQLSANMLYLAKKGSLEVCRTMAERAIADGSAFDKLVAMVGAQGGDTAVILDTEKFAKAPYVHEVIADKAGHITKMDTEKCGIASVILGAGRETKESPIDFAAGIVMKKKVGDIVAVGDVLATLYTSKEASIGGAERLYKEALTINDAKPVNEPLIFARVEKDSVEKF